jgi:hypothetical protein
MTISTDDFKQFTNPLELKQDFTDAREESKEDSIISRELNQSYS